MLLKEHLWPASYPCLLKIPSKPCSWAGLPEVSAMIGVRVAILGHDDAVRKFAPSQALHGLLTVEDGCKLHEDLQETLGLGGREG